MKHKDFGFSMITDSNATMSIFQDYQGGKGQICKRKCRIRVIDFSFHDNTNAQHWDRIEEELRAAVPWQDAYCYEMRSEMFSVEDMEGFPHCVAIEDIQFLDTKEFYESELEVKNESIGNK